MKTQTPRQYLKENAIWSAGINLVLNLLAGWLIYRKSAFIPMEGQTSIRGDTTVMVWLIVFFSLLLAVPGIKKAMKEGKLLKYENAHPFPAAISWILSRGLAVATVISFLCVFTLVPLILWLLGLAGVDGLATWPFLGYKTVLATLTAGTVIPLIDWLVIRNESAKK
jgi:hypothetical protein